MTTSERVMLSLAVASGALALSASWIWAGLYHRFQPAAHIAAAVALLCAVAFGAVLVMLSSWRRGEYVARFVLVFLVLYCAYAVAFPAARYEHSPLGVRLTFFLVVVAVAGFCAAKGHRRRWMRASLAVIVAAVVFAASFPVLGRFVAIGAQPAFSRQFLQGASNAPSNVLIALFDETSPELVAPIRRALESDGLVVSVASIEGAGKNTINVIPAMLTGQRFDGALPCGSTLLCSDGGALDFASLRVPPQFPTDVVALFHPYCAIGGLRSCRVVPWSRVDRFATSLKQLLCDQLLAEVDCARRFGPVESRLRRYRSLPESLVPRKPTEEDWLKVFWEEIDAAPFWKEGGTLYTHVPLPHLPSRVTTGNLRNDYLANVDDAAAIAGELGRRLRARFGDDFLIVITSDHPLRLDLACDLSEYAGEACAEGLPENKGVVPFITASIRPVGLTPPRSLLGLLK